MTEELKKESTEQTQEVKPEVKVDPDVAKFIRSQMEEKRKKDNETAFKNKIDELAKSEGDQSAVIQWMRENHPNVENDPMVLSFAQRGETEVAFNLMYDKLKSKKELEQIKSQTQSTTQSDTDTPITLAISNGNPIQPKSKFEEVFPMDEKGRILWNKVNPDLFDENQRDFIRSRKKQSEPIRQW